MTAAPAFFETAPDFRRWLESNHQTAGELLVGFCKKGSGRPSIDWPQARDEALCFGWIDGVRKSIDAQSYSIRFTPRRRGSIWGKVNVARFQALKGAGLMTADGEPAFEENKGRTGVYAYENEQKVLSTEETALFRQNQAAWTDWEKRPPGYRKVALHWITSAKKPKTRTRRLAVLIADSAAGKKLGVMDVSRKKT